MRAGGADVTIGSFQFAMVLEGIRALGVSSATVSRILGVSPDSFAEADARVPTRVPLRLLREAERHSSDDMVGLHLGERFEHRGPIAYLVMSSTTLRQGIDMYRRFSRIGLDSLDVRLSVRGDVASLVFDPGFGTASGNRHLMDFILIASTRMFRYAVGSGFRLREVHVRHVSGRNRAAETARAFGCAVRFGCSDYRLVFPASDLESRPSMANPLLAEQIEKFTATLARQIEATTFRARVEAAMRAVLTTGVMPSREAVARRLRMSERTLQRHLESEQADFKTTREAVLRELAEAQLWNAQLPIKEIAVNLGFADVAAFSKAYRRWTGRSPSAQRERMAKPRTLREARDGVTGAR